MNQSTKETQTATKKVDPKESQDDVKVSDVNSPRADRTDNRITVNIIQGRNLPAADANGLSDPYVKVTFVSKSQPKIPLEQSRTRVIRKNLNPVWNDAVVCEGVGIIHDCQAIELQVWDYDAATKDDFLGSATIDGIQSIKGSSLPAWVGLKNRKGKDAGEIQIQITLTEDYNTLNVRDWTHILELNIGHGTDLDKMPWFTHARSKPFVRIEWGTQVLHSSKLLNTKDPQWNDKAFLFVHREKNEKYFLQVTVMDDAVKNEAVGQGVISARKIFEAKEEEPVEKTIALSKMHIELDNILNLKNLEAQENAKPECGLLTLTLKLHPKEHVQARYYEAIVDHFDENKNGTLEKTEVQKLLLSLDIPQDADLFFRKYDEDADDIWSKEEIINMLKDYDFQRSPWMALALEHFLKEEAQNEQDSQNRKNQSAKQLFGTSAGNPSTSNASRGTCSFDAHLMSGVTEAPRIGNERQIIKVKDRATGLVIQENIPGYVWQAMQLMYNSSSGRVFASRMTSVLTKMSRDKGKEYDAPKSAAEIPHFIELHNLDMSIMLKKDISDYATFNDFFARAIDPKARPLDSPDNEDVVVSPADCRMVLFPTVLASRIWVKGSNWTLGNLLRERYEAIGKKLEGGGFVIARLAPQDYHRFHWPVSGKVLKITPIDGALYTVNPIAINQPINVYTENKRCIIEIDTGEDKFGLVVMIAVGATMVGSYNLFEKDGVNLKEGSNVCRGEVSGEFRFGASTVLLLFEKDTVRFDEDLVTSTEEKLETLIQVGNRIGERIPRKQ